MRPAAALAVKLAAQPAYDGSDEFWRLIRSLDDDMTDLFRRYASGKIGEAEWFRLFDQLLFDGHTSGYLVGSRQGGRESPIGMARLVGREMADAESYFLQGFMFDLRRGRYEDENGELQMSRVMNRARLYQGKVRGTTTKGFVDGSPERATYEWVLGGVEDHCGECHQLAEISRANPFVRDTLFQMPGDGSTPCLGNCKCHLVRLDDGATSQTAAL